MRNLGKKVKKVLTIVTSLGTVIAEFTITSLQAYFVEMILDILPFNPSLKHLFLQLLCLLYII